MFPGDFTLADAIAAAADHGIDDTEAVGAVVGLVSKSLAMADISGPVTRYRLPETTRAYARVQ
jgi:predicted ATPase